jgi:TRAP-type mannitol/chloroaromatic compound transport system substrate-binding protein
MDKKEIYEHLAKIYLDASLKNKKKRTQRYSLFKNIYIYLFGSVFILSLSLLVFFNMSRNKSLNSEIALILQPEAVKINFHFDPARKETYSIDLNKLVISGFKALAFSAKKANYNDNTSLRVEFTSAFKEKSEVYVKNISNKWQDYKIALSEFKNISDWSDISKLSFIVEEWNVREKKGVVYVDNIRFIR